MEEKSAEQVLYESLDKLHQLQGSHREAAFRAVAAFVDYLRAATQTGGAGPVVLSPTTSSKTTGTFKCPGPGCGYQIVAEYK